MGFIAILAMTASTRLTYLSFTEWLTDWQMLFRISSSLNIFDISLFLLFSCQNPFSLEDAATLMTVENDDFLISMVRFKMQQVPHNTSTFSPDLYLHPLESSKTVI